MSESEENVKLCEEIIADLVQMQQLASRFPNLTLRVANPWLQIPHPKGLGGLFSSDVSSENFKKLAERSQKNNGLVGRVTLENLRRALIRVFADRFIKQHRPISEQEVSKLLSAAAKHVVKKCKTRTYYLPLRFLFKAEPELIELGPVKIRPVERTGQAIAPMIRDYLRETDTVEMQKWSRTHLQECLEYYRNFKWVAEVTIRGCDGDMAQVLAFDVAHSAIDCLHVILSRHYTNRMKVGGIATRDDKRAIMYVEEGRLHVSSSSGGLDHVGFAEGWSKELQREDLAEMLARAGEALEARADRTIERPISERFLDAAMWFGQAVRDDNLAAKSVKYVTSVERLVTAGTVEKIQETVCTRVADILFDPNDPEQWTRDYDAMKVAYRLRSKLVHGTLSPTSRLVEEGVANCGQMAENLLGAVLFRFGPTAFEMEKFSTSQYAEWLSEVRSHIDRVRST